MNDYTLVAYIGDHNIVETREETLKQKRDKVLGSLSMHANLQELAKNRTNPPRYNGESIVPGRGYNTLSGKHFNLYSIVLHNIFHLLLGGVASVKQINSLPRKQRSQSLERARSPTHRASNEDTRALPLPGLNHVSSSQVYISDPDMLASKLAEQEYLQSLGNFG